MPERGFDDGFWSNPDVMKLPKDAKVLLAYLFTNQHCNQAGLYKISPETIAFETKLAEAEIPNLFALLEKKIKWYPEENLVWVKNFIKRQAKSPKFLIAAAKCLSNIKHNGAVLELIEYNHRIHSISIPYPYSTSSIPIPSISSASASADLLSSSSKKEEIVKKGKEDKELAKMEQLYGGNIGPLFPLIIERLRELRGVYPVEWFEEAVREAVRAEHRNLKYIEAILARWKAEGFKTQKRQGKNDDPDKYIKGKYGHLVQR